MLNFKKCYQKSKKNMNLLYNKIKSIKKFIKLNNKKKDMKM